jgi:hypothetical protein
MNGLGALARSPAVLLTILAAGLIALWLVTQSTYCVRLHWASGGLEIAPVAPRPALP